MATVWHQRYLWWHLLNNTCTYRFHDTLVALPLRASRWNVSQRRARCVIIYCCKFNNCVIIFCYKFNNNLGCFKGNNCCTPYRLPVVCSVGWYFSFTIHCKHNGITKLPHMVKIQLLLKIRHCEWWWSFHIVRLATKWYCKHEEDWADCCK